MATEPSKASEYLEFLTYHRDAMQDRRRVELKAFTGAMAVVLLLLKGVPAFMAQVTCTIGFKWAAGLTFAAIPILFFLFVRQIEQRNWANKRSYMRLERKLNNLLPAPDGQGTDPAATPNAEGQYDFGDGWAQAWAAIYPTIALTWLSIAAIVVVVLLKS